MTTGSYFTRLHGSNCEISGISITIYCPGCDMRWMPEFVPEYCPMCGAKVTDNPTASCERVHQYMKKSGSPFSQCQYCKRGFPIEPGKFRNTCPYCKGELRLTQKASRFYRRKFMKSKK